MAYLHRTVTITFVPLPPLPCHEIRPYFSPPHSAHPFRRNLCQTSTHSLPLLLHILYNDRRMQNQNPLADDNGRTPAVSQLLSQGRMLHLCLIHQTNSWERRLNQMKHLCPYI